MMLSRKEIRLIINEFNYHSNRLLMAHIDDYKRELAMFLKYVTDTEIIHDFIIGCGECEQDMDQAFSQVMTKHCIFDLGSSPDEETCIVFSILNYIVSKNINLAMLIVSYSSSRTFQQMLKDFNARVTSILINRIERHLTEIGIQMGLDGNITYNIETKTGQVIIANDNATVNTSNTNINIEETNQIIRQIEQIRMNANSIEIPNEDKVNLLKLLETIENEVKSEKPERSVLSKAVNSLKTYTWPVALVADITSLIACFAHWVN